MMNNQELKQYVKEIKSTIDISRIQEIEQIIINHPNIQKEIRKYCQVDDVLLKTLRYAGLYFKIDEKPKLDILDIGSGCGWFPYVCKHFQHNVYLSDVNSSLIDLSQLLYVNNLFIYDKILNVLHLIKNYNIEIQPYISMNLDRKFDAITTLETVFPNDTLWTIDTWKFLINDMITNLNINKETYIFIVPNFCPSIDNLLKDHTQLLDNNAIKNITIYDAGRIFLINVFKKHD